MPLPLGAYTIPPWVYPGAKFDFDFANQRYWGESIAIATSSALGGAMKPSGAYASGNSYTPQVSGILKVFGANTARITDLGLCVECVATNSCLWSRDLTNAAWTAVTCTVAKNQVGNDDVSIKGGTLSASSLTATSAAATVLQTITGLSSGTNYIFSAYVKRLTGSGTISMTMDGITYTPITINSSSYTWVKVPAQTGVTTYTPGFKIAINTDAIAVDFCQLESLLSAANLATTPLLTTTVAVSRANEANFFGNNGAPAGGGGFRILNDCVHTGGPSTILTVYAADSNNGTSTGPTMYLSDAASIISYKGGCGNAVTTSDAGAGANVTPNTGNLTRANVNKAIQRVAGAGRTYCLNGGAPSALNTATIDKPSLIGAATHINPGTNGSGSANVTLNGFICRQTYWDRELTDGQLVEFSTIYSNT